MTLPIPQHDRFAGYPLAAVSLWWAQARIAGAASIMLREFQKLPAGVVDVKEWRPPQPFDAVRDELSELVQGRPHFLLVAYGPDGVSLAGLKDVGELLAREP